MTAGELAEYLYNHRYGFATGTFWYINKEELEKIIQQYIDSKLQA